MTGTIFDIKKFSIHDGPGIRTTVFLKGCLMRCRWCHNPESHDRKPELMFRPERCIRCGECLSVCSQGALSLDGEVISHHRDKCVHCGDCAQVCHAQALEMIGREVHTEEVMAEIKRDIPFYEQSGGGVTFSGGEPLLQPKFLRSLLKHCRERSIHTAVDTCGFVDWKVMDGIRAYVDLFLYDLKLMDGVLHRKFTDATNTLILKNLQTLSERGHNIIIRVPIVPQVTDTTENLRQIGAFAAGLPRLSRLDILPYYHIAVEKYRRLDRDYSLEKARPPAPEKMSQIAKTLGDFGLPVHIGG